MLDHKYKVFYHLARNPNTTQVAEELHQTQPAISKSLRELEKELGITLFFRTKGRMHLTEAGLYLFGQVEEVMQKERETAYGINQMRNSFEGELHIGASTTLSQNILPTVVARFTTAFPQIKISLINGNTKQIEDAVVENHLHLAFIEGTPTRPDLHYIPYLEDEIVPVCATGTQLPESLTKETFGQYPFVFRERGSGTYHVIKQQLAGAGISIERLQEQAVIGSTEGIKHYLCHSECIAFLSVYSIRNELANGKLRIIETEDLTIRRTLYAIHRSGEPDPYAMRFLDFAQNEKNI